MPIEGAFLTKVVVVDPPSRGAVIPTKPHNDPNNRRIYVKYKNQVSEVEVSIQNRVFVKGSVVGAWVLANGTVFRIEGDEYGGAYVTQRGELRSGNMACQADRMTSNISSLMCSICIASASGAAVTGLWMIACMACLIATVVPTVSFNYMHGVIAKYITGER